MNKEIRNILIDERRVSDGRCQLFSCIQYAVRAHSNSLFIESQKRKKQKYIYLSTFSRGLNAVSQVSQHQLNHIKNKINKNLHEQSWRPSNRDRFEKSTERMSSKMKGFKWMPNTSVYVRAYFAKQQHWRLKANRVRLVQVAIHMYASVAFIIIYRIRLTLIANERATVLCFVLALIRVTCGISYFVTNEKIEWRRLV